MIEYNRNGTRIMNPDKSNNSTVQKYQKTLHCRVNWQRCTPQGQLLSQTVLTGQSA